MALPDRLRAAIGDVRGHVLPVAVEVYDRWPEIAFIWGRSDGSSGEHPLGLALDFSVLEYGGGVASPGPERPELGRAIAEYLWENRDRLNVWYIIWSRRIISTNPDSYAYNEWTTYDGDNPHTDHVHVSFYADRSYNPPERDWFDMATKAELREVVDAAIDARIDDIVRRVLRQVILDPVDRREKRLSSLLKHIRVGTIYAATEAERAELAEAAARNLNEDLADEED